MVEKNQKYRAIISSDWNGCLSPGGPYDPISFVYPDLTDDLRAVFQRYTANEISLGTATERLQEILPGPISPEQMDAYLDKSFRPYKGVPEFISWCLSQNILFMINTTGATGYFQRVFARGFLPRISALSANPMIRYPHSDTDPQLVYDLLEIEDKARNTEKVVHQTGISAGKVFLIGDSGGDGPHFKWGASQGAFLIGSMTKPSLKLFCQKNGIAIDLFFGVSYGTGEGEDPEKEKRIDFMELSRIIGDKLRDDNA